LVLKLLAMTLADMVFFTEVIKTTGWLGPVRLSYRVKRSGLSAPAARVATFKTDLNV